MFKKGAQSLNLNYQQEFLVNLKKVNQHDIPSDFGVKRTMKDFRKLAQTIDKTCFGIYIPYIP